MQEIPTRDKFAENKNSIFKVAFGPDTVVDMELAEVSEVKESGRAGQFSLLFFAPPDAPVLQDTFEVGHPRLGTMHLLLVPIGRNERGIEYEAVFSFVTGPPSDYS